MLVEELIKTLTSLNQKWLKYPKRKTEYQTALFKGQKEDYAYLPAMKQAEEIELSQAFQCYGCCMRFYFEIT